MNIWRQQPSSRLKLSFFIQQISSGVAQDIAEDFFEYTAPAPPSAGANQLMLMGCGV